MSNSEIAPTLGSYRLLGILGQGAMGVVYRAEHIDTRRPAALKTVTVPRLGLLQSIRREIHALARLRHPGIVPILNEGVQDQLPWYAMELVQGTTLRLWARERGKDGLREKLSVVCRLCSALAYMHGEGIIHRDLKPENVLVTEPGSGGSGQDLHGAGRAIDSNAPDQPVADGAARPVLVDFGLVSRFASTSSREALETLHTSGGTVAYMAPEQGRGELVDARADLSSLGCILYELVTGRCPFEGWAPMQVLYQHLTVPPTPPSKLCSDLPRDLDALILGLLAKEPRQRPGHAGVVAAALVALGAEAPPLPGPKPQAYLYRPSLAGRQEPLEKLRAAIQRIDAGSGRLVLIRGESGVGKTRLSIEAAREARLGGILVLTGECYSSGTPGPLQGLRQPLRQIADVCREGGAPETDRLLGRRGKLLALYEPALASLPGQDAYPQPAELPPDAAQLRLLTYLTDSFAALARGTSVLLILDDLQWADELSLRWLELLLESGRLERMRLLVLGTYRSDEIESTPASRLMQGLVRHPRSVELALGRLDEADVKQMIGDMLALEAPPDAFVQALSRQSEGNPFFVGESLRAAIAEELLYRDDFGRWQLVEPDVDASSTGARQYERLPLTSSVRELVGRHLASLSAPARQLAQVGAVLGREMEEDLLAEVAGLDGGPRMEAVAELLARQMLEEIQDGRLRFVHDKFREVAYERLEPGQGKRIHLDVARALAVRKSEDLGVLARHWEQGGQVDKARPCYLAGARRAKSRAAHGEAEELYRAYLRLVPAPTLESIAARNEMAHDALRILGRVFEAAAEHRQALVEARGLRDRGTEGRTLWYLGMLRYESAPLDESRAFFEQAAELARQVRDCSGEAQALRGLSLLFHGKGLPEQSRAHLIQSLAIFREIGDRKNEGIVLANLGVLELEQGRPDAARDLYEQALAIHRAIPCPAEEGNVLHNLAVLDGEQGRYDDARRRFEQALVLGRELGARRFEGHVLGGLAAVAGGVGRIEEAIALCEQSLAIHREVLNPRHEATTLSNLAELYVMQGRVPEARTLFDQAIALNRRTGSRRGEGIALHAKAALDRRSGRLVEAAELLEQAAPILEQLGDAVYLISCLCQLGHLSLAREQPETALEIVQRARLLAEPLSMTPEGEVAQAIGRLERAAATQASGRPLWFGECIEDVPDALVPSRKPAKPRC